MTRAIIIHSHFEKAGGAELYCLRVVEVLQRRFDEVLILHYGADVDVAALERRFNLSLDRRRVVFHCLGLGRVGNQLDRLFRAGLSQLKTALFYRRVSKLVPDCDLLVTTWIEYPFRAPRLIQCLQIPMMVYDRESLKYLGREFSGKGRYLLQVLYVITVQLVMSWNRKTIGEHLTILNSCWSKDQFLRHYPARDARALYPGVDPLLADCDEKISFAQRENNFVVIGRVAPEKFTHIAVEIVKRLRAIGHDVGLHVIGSGSGPYAEAMEALIAANPWARWHRHLGMRDMKSLVMRQKWGLHCFEFEHYGIAPAELQAMGCITFVPDYGGQREIILNPDQRYRGVKDAVEKIDRVLRSPQTHAELVEEGRKASRLHTLENFRAEFLKIVEEAMAQPA